MIKKGKLFLKLSIDLEAETYTIQVVNKTNKNNTFSESAHNFPVKIKIICDRYRFSHIHSLMDYIEVALNLQLVWIST